MILFKKTKTDTERLDDYERITNEVNESPYINIRVGEILIIKIVLIIARHIIKRDEGTK